MGKCLTKAIAAKLQVIGINTRAIITEIECSLARIGSTRVSIRHKHLGQRETIEEATAIIPDIVQGQTLSVVEAYSEAPLLPLEVVALNSERRALWLDNLVWLGGRPRLWPQIRVVFTCGCRMDSPAVKWLLFVIDPFVGLGRQTVDLGDLEGLRDLSTDVQRVCVVVSIGVVKQPEVEPALDGVSICARLC